MFSAEKLNDFPQLFRRFQRGMLKKLNDFKLSLVETAKRGWSLKSETESKVLAYSDLEAVFRTRRP